MAKEFIPQQAVYTPQDSSRFAFDAIDKIRNTKMRGIKLNLPGVRDYFAPILPGQLTVILAQTSHYKSGFAHYWEREAARQLLEEGRTDEAIIHISVEECVEEQAFIDIANDTGIDSGKIARAEIQDWERLKQACTRIASIPIYRIGDSLARSEDMPNLYLSNIIRSLRSLTDGEVTGDPIKPALIVVDYLQALPIDPEVKQAPHEAQRRLQVREDTYRLRQASSFYMCPVVVLVQAKQHLDNAKSDWSIPGIYDGEESSSIAQRADRIIGLWMPARTMTVGDVLDHGGKVWKVAEDMLFVKVLKQRGGLPAGSVWLFRIDFSKNELKPEAV